MAGKFGKLMGNTLIFAIGSFASKAMVLILMPLYTRVLTDAQFGAADLVSTTANLLTPFVMLSINEAIIRFAMDRAYKKEEVFTVGIQTTLLGILIFGLFSPIMLKIKLISPYVLLIFLYVAAAAIKLICAQFVRSCGWTRLFALDGFLATLTTILFNILYLLVFKWGSTGFILSIISSNVLSVIFLTVTARLWRYVRRSALNKDLRRQMIKYSVPIIPTTMFWWITTASDRFVVTYFCGEGVNGIYSASHKLPGLLTIVSAVFYQAWQISAMDESGKGEKTEEFYNEVYEYYIALLFLACSGLIMVCRPVISVWLSKNFYDSWMFVPFLAIAEVFSTLVTFLGSFYMVSKQNKTIVLAIGAGAVCNMVLNLILVPKYGALGAAFATVVSYILSFCVRGWDIKRFVNIDLRSMQVIVCVVVLAYQTYSLFNCDWQYPIIKQLLIFLAMCLVNITSIVKLVKSFLQAVLPKILRRGRT